MRSARTMQKYLYLAYDIACVCLALVAALYLRHGIPLIQEGQPEDLYLLLMVTFTTAATVLILMDTHSSIWRFTSSSELSALMIAVALIVLICNSTLFFISRLEMMPRSVPPMHWALAAVMMGGSRLVVRRLSRPTRAAPKHQPALRQHVMVVGACHTADLYMQFIKRIVQRQVVVEGFVDSDVTLTHWTFQKRKILGTPADLPRLIEEFLVHGIHIKQVVLAQTLDELPFEERDVLLELERSGVVELVHFAKDVAPQFQQPVQKNTGDFYQYVSDGGAIHYEKPVGWYPYIKRAFDIIVGVALLIVLMPLMAMTSLAVALDVGFPVIFWQKRPGLYGKPFHLHKFRTMRPARRRVDEDRLSHKSGDTMRTSFIGKTLRRLRLDELPQLFHIIMGTMSFVGPRPLLPDDQPLAGEVRLSVRPGVTGWAQIHGGDALTPEEKLMLDVWYIRHMSWWLDIRILFRTLLVLVNADMRRTHAIDQIRASISKDSANA